jgi:hypothetical protein
MFVSENGSYIGNQQSGKKDDERNRSIASRGDCRMHQQDIPRVLTPQYANEIINTTE